MKVIDALDISCKFSYTLNILIMHPRPNSTTKLSICKTTISSSRMSTWASSSMKKRILAEINFFFHQRYGLSFLVFNYRPNFKTIWIFFWAKTIWINFEPWPTNLHFSKKFNFISPVVVSPKLLWGFSLIVEASQVWIVTKLSQWQMLY